MGAPISTQERPTHTRPSPSNRGPPVARLPARPAPRHPVGRPANTRRTPPQAAALRLTPTRLLCPSAAARPPHRPRPPATPERPSPAVQGTPARLGQAATSSALARLLVSARAYLSQERQIVRRQANGCHTNHLRFWLGLPRQLPQAASRRGSAHSGTPVCHSRAGACLEVRFSSPLRLAASAKSEVRMVIPMAVGSALARRHGSPSPPRDTPSLSQVARLTDRPAHRRIVGGEPITVAPIGEEPPRQTITSTPPQVEMSRPSHQTTSTSDGSAAHTVCGYPTHKSGIGSSTVS